MQKEAVLFFEIGAKDIASVNNRQKNAQVIEPWHYICIQI